MNNVNENALNFMKLELKKAQIEVSQKESGREAVDFNIRVNNGNSYQLFFKSIAMLKTIYIYLQVLFYILA